MTRTRPRAPAAIASAADAATCGRRGTSLPRAALRAEPAPSHHRDREIVRNLARRVAEIAALPIQAERARLWTACNNLRPERAMVLATQQPMDELDRAWLRLACTDERYRRHEIRLRHVIMRLEQVPDDFPILGHYPVSIPIHGAGYNDYGIERLTTRSGDNAGAYHIEPVIRSERDMAKLHFRPVEVDQEAADRMVAEAQEVLGDILTVRQVGKMGWRHGLSRVLIHMRGLEQMMLDMYDNPPLLHRLMAFLRDDFLHEIDVLERANALSLNNTPDNITGPFAASLEAFLVQHCRPGSARPRRRRRPEP